MRYPRATPAAGALGFSRRSKQTGTTMTNNNGIPIAAIEKLVAYLYDEEKHFRECELNGEETGNHIFRAVKAVGEWLDRAHGIG
jgi:hypothetical protein